MAAMAGVPKFPPFVLRGGGFLQLACKREAHPAPCRRSEPTSAQLCAVREDSHTRPRVPLGTRTKTVTGLTFFAAAALRTDYGDGTRMSAYYGGQRRRAYPRGWRPATGVAATCAQCRRSMLRHVARCLDSQGPRRVPRRPSHPPRAEADATETFRGTAAGVAAPALFPYRHRRLATQRQGSGDAFQTLYR